MFKTLFASAAVALALSAGSASAQWAPDGSVTMLTMFPPGGGGDVLSRAIAAHFEESLGWNVVVENTPGGGGAAMARVLMAAPTDGLTIGFAVSETFSFVPIMNPNVGYGPENFEFLGAVANTQIGWVARSDAPYSTLEELVEAARNGAEINVGVFSPRSNAAVRAIGAHFGVEFTPVPIQSGAEGVNNVLNGHLATTLAAGPQTPHVLSGDLQVLASLEADRLLVGENALTVEESGVGIATFRAKWLLVAPAGVPQEALDAWSAAIESTLGNDGLRTFITERMSLAMVFTPGDVLRDEIINGRSANEALIEFLQ